MHSTTESLQLPWKKTPEKNFGHRIQILGTNSPFSKPILERTAGIFSEKEDALGPPARLLSICLLCFKTVLCGEAGDIFWACSLFQNFQSCRTVQISNTPHFRLKKETFAHTGAW